MTLREGPIIKLRLRMSMNIVSILTPKTRLNLIIKKRVRVL